MIGSKTDVIVVDDNNDNCKIENNTSTHNTGKINKLMFYKDTKPIKSINNKNIPIYKKLKIVDGTSAVNLNMEQIVIAENNKTNIVENNSCLDSDDLDNSVIYMGEVINLDNYHPTQKSSTLSCKKSINSNEKCMGDKNNINKKKKIKNVDTNLEKSNKRMIIIDGSNVAYGHALQKVFSVRGLEICINYFKNLGHKVKAVVPQYRLKKDKSSDSKLLEKLYNDGYIVLTPCKQLLHHKVVSYDDRFIIELASELDAAIISNDNYSDLINENPTFKQIIENRVVGYTWCDDLFKLPKDPYGRLGPSLSAILNK